MITSGAPPDGTVGQSYFFQATATDGQGGLTLWAIPTQTIPGLEYGDNGVLAGTPTSAALGTWDVDVTIYDQCEPEPQIMTQTYSITIGE